MCKYGDTVDVEVLVCGEVSYSGADERKVKPIDRCISDVVRALDAGGVAMLGSCCGHGRGHGWGQIMLRDGREVWIREARR